MIKKILILFALLAFSNRVHCQKVSLEFGVSYVNVESLNTELVAFNIFPVSSSFMTGGFIANLVERPKHSLDIVYRVSSNLNNSEFTPGSKDVTFNFQTAGFEYRSYKKSVGKFSIEPVLGLHYLWTNLVISDPLLDSSSIKSVLTSSQTTQTIDISRRMTTLSLGGRFAYQFQIKNIPFSIGIHPRVETGFPGGFDSGWQSGRQKVYGLEKLNMTNFSVLGAFSMNL